MADTRQFKTLSSHCYHRTLFSTLDWLFGCCLQIPFSL